MAVQVRHRLRHGVVHRHEGALSTDRFHDCSTQALLGGQEASVQIGRQIGQSGDVLTRDQQHMSLKDRTVVEEGHEVVIGHHHVRGDLGGHDPTEEAGHLLNLDATRVRLQRAWVAAHHEGVIVGHMRRTSMIALLSATALALSGCQQDSGPSPGAGSSGSNATPSESPSPSQSTPPAPSGPPFVSGPSSGEGGALGATMVKRIRSGSHNGFDRVVIDLNGPAPSWQADYVDELVQDGSGEPAPIQGTANLQVIVQAAGHDDMGNPVYRGRQVARPGLPTLQAWAVIGDFEGQFTVGLALESQADYRVFTLKNPTRLVIDVKH